ncbi:MAG: DUF533 domain-containing protein [Kofleriaceae bacterium]
MADSQVLTVIRMWAAVAWADGVLAQAEADSLRRLIQAADLTPEEQRAAARVLQERVSLPEVSVHSMSPEARRGVYRAACRMAAVDHSFAHAERAILDRLRTALEIPVEIATEIEADVPGVGT